MPKHIDPSLSTLDQTERRKRKREWIAIIALALLFVGLTIAELRLSTLSSTLPFVNSIFFFGLLNINLILLIALCWLIFRNVGKLIMERRRKIMGSQLKSKLVLAFLAFSVIPTVVLFVISAAYINSSFDKWFSIKIQNTFQTSLEITKTIYRNADRDVVHFATQVSSRLATGMASAKEIEGLRALFNLDLIEVYPTALDERIVATRALSEGGLPRYPRLSLDLLERAFKGERVSQVQHLGTGDLIRCLVPVGSTSDGLARAVVGVALYIPVSLVNKVDEIASVLDDYKDTNPLKYPMKTTYFVILIMITLVILAVAIWLGLYMARELVVPLQRLVHGAQAVGAGNLNVTISGTGHDEISVLVTSFNKMTRDLRENRKQLTEATGDLERRRMQLEAVLANIGTGVIVVDRSGELTTYNRAVSQLLKVPVSQALGKNYHDVLIGEMAPLAEIVERCLNSFGEGSSDFPEVIQWSYRDEDQLKSLAAIASSLRESSAAQPWGAVLVIDDMTHLIKAQREMAWREVARRIAHEIKNPLTPIKLSAQRLQRRMGDYAGKDAALLKECTETIIQHTDELKEMVNEFSTFARFPEVTPQLQELNPALKEVMNLFEQGHSEIKFSFKPDPSLPPFEYDRDQLKRVIINLLDNSVAAILGSKVRGEVGLETHFHPELGMAVIHLKDNGPGMSEEVRTRLFEPYFSTKSEGTGLGLAIAKRIINDHGGVIRVQSEDGKGTQFWIELPTRVGLKPIHGPKDSNRR